MDYIGPNLQADLEEIWKASVVNFPDIAVAYRMANVITHQTNASHDPASWAFRNWTGLRDEFESIMGWSATTLHDTAAALREAVRGYAATDANAADALNRAASLHGDAEPSPLPPLAVPENQQGPGRTGFDPGPPGDVAYKGKAPTIKELLAKAQTVQDKFYEAAYAEMDQYEQTIADLIPILAGESSGADGGPETVPDVIGKAAKVEVFVYEAAIDCLKRLTGSFGQGFSTFTDEFALLGTAISSDKWCSPAADAFHDNFIVKYPSIAATQGAILATLKEAVERLQQAREQAYTQYDQAMDLVIEACDAIIQEREAAEEDLLIAEISAVISIISVPATGGTSGALAFALAGSGISVGQAAAKVGGSDFPTVKASFLDAIAKAKEVLDSFDHQLAEALASDVELVRGERLKPGGEVDLPRPDFVGNPALL